MEIDKAMPDRESLQYNSQDLDQEQNMEVKPVQNNTQRLYIVVNNEKADYSGIITGVTCNAKNNRILSDVGILLFFGSESKIPVYRTKSDASGNFKIEKIPPGFYTIIAQYSGMEIRTQYIKVLPGQEAYQTLLV